MRHFGYSLEVLKRLTIAIRGPVYFTGEFAGKLGQFSKSVSDSFLGSDVIHILVSILDLADTDRAQRCDSKTRLIGRPMIEVVGHL